MKKTITMLAFGISASFAFAQKIKEDKVPAAVRDAFKKEYPKATNVKWENEKGDYEAGFNAEKIAKSVLYDVQGHLKETEVKIEMNQLPKGVLEYVKEHYPEKPAKAAAKITDVNGMITYEVEVKGMDLLFDTEGKFLKEVKD